MVVDFDFGQVCDEYYSAIVKSADKGITNREMTRQRPFTKYQHYHAEIIKYLIEARKIQYAVIPKNKQGKSRKAYTATGLFYTDERKPLNFNPVYWDNNSFKWVVQAKALKNNIIIHVGNYDTEEEAIKKYNEFIDRHPEDFPE